MSTAPRIPPGDRRDIGIVNYGIARFLALAAGGRPPHIFTTLSRHRRLFRRWLRFAAALMPGGVLPRVDSELVILRVAANCNSEYETRHHEVLGPAAGLTAEEVAGARIGPDAPGWTDRQRLLLRTADELHDTRTVGDALWGELKATFSDVEIIELCMLVGHYEMLAMTLNALAVVPDELPSRPPASARFLQRLSGRRRPSRSRS